MGCEHTMLTYTRCMDSALCVPLMIDVAVFCAYFAQRRATPDDAAKALAYLFKLNEGAAIGVDPGFFNQSAALLELLQRLPEGATPARAGGGGRPGATARREEGGRGGRVIGGVLCAGLSCLDMTMMRAEVPASTEAIATFRGCEFVAGGSTSNSAGALRDLGIDACVLTCVGDDTHGAELLRQYESRGIDTSLIVTEPNVSTSLAVLPVFEAGGRGCWVDLSANDRLTPETILEALGAPSAHALRRDVRALLVGYPHLLRNLQGEALRSLLSDASATIQGGAGAEGARIGEGAEPNPDRDPDPEGAPVGEGAPLLGVDVNGATLGGFGDADAILGPALPLMDVLHANLDEARHLVGVREAELDESSATPDELASLVEPLLAEGVAIVAVTLGAHGAYVAVTGDGQRLERSAALKAVAAAWRGQAALLPALPIEGELNANGAGDAFTAGLLAAMLWREADGDAALSLEHALHVALLTAHQRVDSARRKQPQTIAQLVKQAYNSKAESQGQLE